MYFPVPGLLLAITLLHKDLLGNMILEPGPAGVRSIHLEPVQAQGLEVSEFYF